MSVTYRVIGVDRVRKMLKAYTNPTFKRRMQQAVKAGGNELRAPLRSESRTVSRRMGRAVTVKATPSGLVGRLRRTSDPRVYVGYQKKKAWFAHIVIGGSKDHGPRKAKAMSFYNTRNNEIVVTRRVRGVKANPIVSRVAQRHEGSVYRAIDHSLDRTEPK